VDVPDVFTQAFRHRKGQQEVSEDRRMGYALFQLRRRVDKFTADANSPADCGHSCHVAVKAKDYIFHRTRSVDRSAWSGCSPPMMRH